MHRANLTIIITTIPVLLLAATVAISVIVSEDAFARERYSGDSNCGGTVSQQDESGQASTPITSQTANPAIELQRSTTTTPPPGLGASMTCEECFDILSATQETAVEQLLAGGDNPLEDSLIWGANPPTTIEELCQIWATFNSQQRGSADSDILELLDGVAEATQVEVVRCLNASPFTPTG